MHNHVRYRMPVDDFAFARGATAPVASKAGVGEGVRTEVHRGDRVWQGPADRSQAAGHSARSFDGCGFAEPLSNALARLRDVCNWAIGRDLLSATAFHPRGIGIPAKSERRRERRVSEAEEQRLLDACKLLNEPTRSMAKLIWDDVREI
jgi:hypothetical protein